MSMPHPGVLPRSFPLAYAAGISLVELMVAIAVGSVVAITASVMIVSAKSAYILHTESAQLEETGRYALEAVGRAVRQAAFEHWSREQAALVNLAEITPAIMGLDARSLKENDAGIDSPLNKSINGSDVLAIRFIGNGSGEHADDAMSNCAGYGVTEPVDLEHDRGWSIFYVASDKSGEPELRCKYRGKSGWNSEAVARGIESFQVLYGIDTDADGLPNRFLNADGIAGLDAALKPEGNNAVERKLDRNRKTHWKKVVAVRLAVLARSAQGIGGSTEKLRYDLFGTEYAQMHGHADVGTRIEEHSLPLASRSKLRKVFAATVRLRNQDACGDA